MIKSSPTLEMVKVVARGLESLNERVVFLGGAATSLLITDPALPHIRTTFDVDVIMEVLSGMDYYRLEDSLRERGFTQSIDSEHPVCRWTFHEVIVDIMPTDEKILGFSNRWYSQAIQQSEVVGIDTETFEAFLANEAFLESIPGHLLPDPANQARYRIVFDRITQIANYG
jgi:hypothetical protein